MRERERGRERWKQRREEKREGGGGRDGEEGERERTKLVIVVIKSLSYRSYIDEFKSHYLPTNNWLINLFTFQFLKLYPKNGDI